MKKYAYIFLSALLSGFCITIGVCVYLSVVQINKIVGSLLFGLGLFGIVHFNLFLYTGKVGNLLDNKPKYILQLIVGILGNIAGAIILASIIKITRIGDNLQSEAMKLIEIKQNDSWYSILILSCLCGVMIYFAVKEHQKCEYVLGKVIFCFIAVSIFILSGYEHCIANVAYYTFAGFFNLKALGFLLLMILGNGIGAVLFDGALKLLQKLKPENE